MLEINPHKTKLLQTGTSTTRLLHSKIVAQDSHGSHTNYTKTMTSSHDDLLVDFLTAPRTLAGPHKTPSVSFSPISGLVNIPTDKIESKAYSKNELLYFRRQVARDARRMRIATTGANMNHEDFIECALGLELYSSETMMRRAIIARRAHTGAVLEEQDSQGDICNAERLALVAKTSSQWAEKRAQQLAFELARLEG